MGVLPHVKKLNDALGQFLVQITCTCGAQRVAEPEALARLCGFSATNPRPRSLGIEIATTSAPLAPHFEQRICFPTASSVAVIGKQESPATPLLCQIGRFPRPRSITLWTRKDCANVRGENNKCAKSWFGE
jgi:hypothetical protein